LQTKDYMNGLIEELRKVIIKEGNPPVYLIGWSWGAWLSFIAASKYPELVKELILVNSGPFEAKYAKSIMQTRLERLTNEERRRVKAILGLMGEGNSGNKMLKDFGYLMGKADAFNPLPGVKDINVNSNIYKKVWGEAEELRKSGELLKYGEGIKCPVVVIHGDYDPHPFIGVKKPLTKVLKNVKFILLKNCGHYPWLEKNAKIIFIRKLIEEIR